MTTNVGDNVQNALGRRKPFSPESREGEHGMGSAGGGIEVFHIGTQLLVAEQATRSIFVAERVLFFFFLIKLIVPARPRDMP